MSIQIQAEHLAVVKEILARRLPGVEVWVFGSRVKGNAKKYSDLDMVIRLTQPVNLTVLAELKEDFSESDLPFKVDVTEWSLLGEAFQNVVKAQYEVLQQRSASNLKGRPESKS